MQEKSQTEEENEIIEHYARLFKYYSQLVKNGNSIHDAVPLNKIRILNFLDENHKLFTKLKFIIEKYKINADKYIKYCIFNRGIQNPNELLELNNFILYANDIKKEEQYNKIYKYYLKSANFIADKCIELNTTPLIYIKTLIMENRLVYEYFSGNISKYFIATFNNLEKIIGKMDKISRDEFGIILDVQRKLNQDVQETFKKFENRRVSPLKFTEQILNNKKQTTK